MKKIFSFLLFISCSATIKAFPWLFWGSQADCKAKNTQTLGEELAQSMRHRHQYAAIVKTESATLVKKIELPEDVSAKLKEVDVKTWRDESGLSLLDIAVANGYVENAIRNAGGHLTENGLELLVSQMASKARYNCLSEVERHEYEKMIAQYTQAHVQLTEHNKEVGMLKDQFKCFDMKCKSKNESSVAVCHNKKVIEYLLATAVVKNK